jgi:hypothetical protein
MESSSAVLLQNHATGKLLGSLMNEVFARDFGSDWIMVEHEPGVYKFKDHAGYL